VEDGVAVPVRHRCPHQGEVGDDALLEHVLPPPAAELELATSFGGDVATRPPASS
jgi:hypothetical protein